MKVRISEVKEGDDEVRVLFSTDIGAAIATWKAPPPKIGKEYEVELEIDEEFIYGENARATQGFYSLAMEEDIINLNARLVSIAEDGVAVIDLAGAKTMIELTGCAPNLSAFIRLSFKKLSMYPIKL